MTADEISILVKRLARPHDSGGVVIERSVILAEGANSPAILNWITDHGGIADFTAAPTRSQGLHGPRANVAPQGAAPARRFVLPESALAAAPEN